VVTYEFENVPDTAAAALSARTVLRPGAEALRISQDRLVEKEFLVAVGLDTAPFAPLDRLDDADRLADAMAAVAPGGPDRDHTEGAEHPVAIVKSRRFGYDGKGQLRLRPGDGPPTPDGLARSGLEASTPSIVEGFVEFEREISVVVARSVDGAIRSFPPAHNQHRDGILRSSTVPAGVAPHTVDAANRAAHRLVEALDYVGVLGLELFVLPDGSVLANEFAPRVHNSGHWTELAARTDQFEQHIRAITGHGLGDTTARACEMVNLIGDEVDRSADLVAAGTWRVHLYGKGEVRPGRKMGHATRLIEPDSP
jgi:5-(carboxyamino)imidazole ribonucleotide synthase